MNDDKTDLWEDLDGALDLVQTGETPAAVLDHYPDHAEELLPLLTAATRLESLRPIEMPSSKDLVKDRQTFLEKLPKAMPVTIGATNGRNRSMLVTLFLRPLAALRQRIAHTVSENRSHLNPRERRTQMISLLVKATLVLTLMFGSMGGAAALAADSLPGSPLYPAKLALEEVRLQLASGPANQAGLHLALAQERIQEIQRVAQTGDVPGEATLERLQKHLNEGLYQAAQSSDGEMLRWLNQAQQMAQAEEQQLAQTQEQAGHQAQERLQQAVAAMHQLRQEAQAGLQDPETFRWRHTKNRPDTAPPQPDVEPEPGCEGDDCEPAGDEHRHGPQPDQPGPGGPGGNSDREGDDCEPAGDQNQNGPQPDQPGPGGPGGNPDCEGDDCEPEGDQNQNGPQPGPGGGGGAGSDGDPGCEGHGCEPGGDPNQNGTQPGGDGQDEGSDGGSGDRGNDSNGGCQGDGCGSPGGQTQGEPGDGNTDSGSGEGSGSGSDPSSSGQNGGSGQGNGGGH